jgi:tetratricopeptide (TPR) repeat protein
MRRFCGLLVLLFVVLNAAMAQEATPKSAIEYNARGLTRYNKGDFDGAIADFNKSIALDPGFWATYMVRGLARDSKGDYDGAIADYDKAIDLNPTFAKPYNDRGHARYQKGDYDGAIADYNKAIELDSGYGAAYANRGRARLSIADYNGALADYDKAVELDPGADTYTGRGLARNASRDFDGAIADFVQAIAFNAKNPETYLGRGAARFQQDDPDGAMADYDKALALNPNYAEAYNSRGIVRNSRGDHVGAISEFTKAIAINPKLALAYYGRGWDNLYLARGEPAHADAVDYLKLTSANKSDLSGLYMVLVGYFGLRQAHMDIAARAFIDEYAKDFNTSDWPYPVIKYLRREITAQELFNLAIVEDKKIEVRARVYLGLDMSLSGQRESALEHLRWVKEYGAITSREYALAVSELSRLEVLPQPTAPKHP